MLAPRTTTAQWAGALAEASGLVESVQDLDELERYLSSPDPRIRLEAIAASGHLEADEVVLRLRHRLAREDHPWVIATLVKWLGKLGGPQEIDLIARFLDSRDPRIRANTVEGLAAIGTSRALEHIAPLLDDPNSRVRANAARALHVHSHERAFATLKKMLFSGDPLVSDGALHALSEIGTDEVVEVFRIAVEEERDEVRWKALSALDRLREGNALAGELYDRFTSGERSLDPEWGPEQEALVQQAARGKLEDRLEALLLLARLAHEKARRCVAHARGDPDPLVRERANLLHGMGPLFTNRKAVLNALGMAAWEASRSGEPDTRGLDRETLDLLKESEARLQGGQDIEASLSMRAAGLRDLAETLLGAYRKDRTLGPDLDPLCSKLREIDTEIDRQLQGPHSRVDGVTSDKAIPGEAPDDVLLTDHGTATLLGLSDLISRAPRSLVVSLVLGGLVLTLLGVAVQMLSVEASRASLRLWKRPGRGPVWMVTPKDTLIVVRASGEVEALQGGTGEPIWQRKMKGGIRTQPVLLSDQRVVVGAKDGSVAALSLSDGQPAWWIRVGGEVAGMTVTSGERLVVLVQRAVAEGAGYRVVQIEGRQGRDLGERTVKGESLTGVLSSSRGFVLYTDTSLLEVPDSGSAPGAPSRRHRFQRRLDRDYPALERAEGWLVASGQEVFLVDGKGRRSPLSLPAGPARGESRPARLLPWGQEGTVVIRGDQVIPLSPEGRPLDVYSLGGRPDHPVIEGDRMYYWDSRSGGVVKALDLKTGDLRKVTADAGSIAGLEAAEGRVFVATMASLEAYPAP